MKAEKIFPGTILMFSFVYLYLQVFPALHVGDSGELIAAGCILGNAHPPGYPLFSILTKIFLAFSRSRPAYGANLAQAVYGSLSVFFAFLLLRSVFTGILKKSVRDTAAFFGSLFMISGTWFIQQATVAEVFMLNLLFIIMILYALQNKKYSLAGFLAGIGLGNQHTLVLVFPTVLIYLFSEKEDVLNRFLSFSIWAAAGMSVYLYMPIRAASGVPLNWGDPSNLKNIVRVITRRDYGTFSLHGGTTPFSAVKALGILKYFFSELSLKMTPAGAAASAAGMFMYIKKRRVWGISLLVFFIFSGPVFFIMTNMDLNSSGRSILARFFLLPYAACTMGAAGIFLIKSRFKYILLILPLYLSTVNFSWGPSRPAALDNYIRDITDTLEKGEPLYVMKGGVGDDMVFGLAYMKWAEGKLMDTPIYSEYASIFDPPVPVKERAAFCAFSPQLPGMRLYQTGLIFKNYPQKIDFDGYRGCELQDNMEYRQRNIAVNYPFFRGMKYLELGDVRKCEMEFNIALSKGSDIPWLMNNIGNTYNRAGMFDKAYRFYQLALDEDPFLAEAYNNIANIFHMRSDWKNAVLYYKKSIDIEPDEVRLYNLGLTYLAMKEYSYAVESFSKALAYNPGYAQIYNDLGLALYRQGKTDEAVKAYAEGLRKDPRNLNMIFNMALAYEMTGSIKADEYWKEYLRISPENDKDRYTAQCYLED
ncbi:MAG: tetratricopeptide repeat protein [Elusimicrobiota bacterium]